ncbi:hypothetical protein E4U17_007610 [Claviceps sp. LM77 group G4]|nr:hypothetical protein E4U17_007610 [Claviceps sp. LM77 group G4]KAG6084338.1 hypothetical protein E4U16_002148 [Claviceps sp. LM84 group G4]
MHKSWINEYDPGRRSTALDKGLTRVLRSRFSAPASGFVWEKLEEPAPASEVDQTAPCPFATENTPLTTTKMDATWQVHWKSTGSPLEVHWQVYWQVH